MKPFTSSPMALICLALLSAASLTSAILVQPHNFAPEDQDQETSGLLLDQDLLKLAQLRDARMAQADSEAAEEHFSQEMADLIHREHQHQIEKQQQATDGQPEPSLSASVAHVLMNVARAAQVAQDQAQASDEQQSAAASSDSQNGNGNGNSQEMSARGSIMELDTSASSAGGSLPSKADLKQTGPKQWFNPKETIPVLKISSMATPSKYKKVYFRAEKKLVDGAFHSPSNEKDDKKSLIKSSSSFNSGVQRRSSRGTSSSVPPGILQDGVIDFLKKFRDVYIQTRPANSASASPSLASSFLASAASSPLATFLAPASSGSRPNLASAISAATSMMSSAAQVAQAASASPAVTSSGSSSGATGAAASSAAAATGNSVKAPLTAQTYVSFWSKTFPTWVRKMLKQMRRRSLYNSSKRYQQHQHHSGASSIGQAAQAAASVASAVEQSGSSSSGSSSSKQT